MNKIQERKCLFNFFYPNVSFQITLEYSTTYLYHISQYIKGRTLKEGSKQNNSESYEEIDVTFSRDRGAGIL